ncbi:MAG: sensor histidine kinase [Hyphomicrobiaceae bacterium]
MLAPLIGKRLTSLNIWTLDGRVAYSTRKEIVGRQFPPTALFKRARDGHIGAEFEGHPHEGDAHDRSPTMRLEIYGPILRTGGDQVMAIAEMYSIREGLAAELQRATWLSWLVVGSIGAAMMTALSGIVFRGSRTIERQDQLLRSQIKDLERLLGENADLSRSLQRSRLRTVAIAEQQLRRVGADLHDGPAQLIGLSLLMLNSTQDMMPGGGAQRAPAADGPTDTGTPGAAVPAADTGLPGVRSALTEALREIRAISTGLIMPEVAKAPLDDLVRHVARTHERRTASKVTVSIATGNYDVPVPLKVCSYRLLQEALNNSWRHADGKGQEIALSRDGDVVQITASDKGPGLPLDNLCHSSEHVAGHGLWTDEATETKVQSGMGLVGLRDRVESLGGRLDLISTESGLALKAIFDLAEVVRRAQQES